MKTFKMITLAIIALISQAVTAGEWKHQEFRQGEYRIRLSYTNDWRPATYGSQGGKVNGIFYVDVNSPSPLTVSLGEIFEVKQGRLKKISELRFQEDHQRHVYARKDRERTYGDYIWEKRDYLLRLHVDGKELEFCFKL